MKKVKIKKNLFWRDKGMKKYKVLRLINGELISPCQNYNYGKLEDVLEKKMICEDFDDLDNECSNGFYATDIQGIIYCLNNNKRNRVFEVDVWGREKIFNDCKQRYEYQKIVRLIPEDEVKELVKAQSGRMDWDYYRACYPVNPLELDIPFDKEKSLSLLKDWASVRASVWTSVLDSVRDFVGASVFYSVRNFMEDSMRTYVRDSVRASVYAYISSLFPNIKKWKYIEHKEGVNPFQSCIDLWNMGLVPSFDGKVWRLYKGKKAEVVLEISREKLRWANEKI